MQKSAKEKAVLRWLKESENKHKDNISSLRFIKFADGYSSIQRQGDWYIELEPDPLHRHQIFLPDWYGYKRIDDYLIKNMGRPKLIQEALEFI